MITLLWIAAGIALTALGVEAVRRLPPALVVALSVAALAALTPRWLGAAERIPPFNYVKVYSVYAALLFVSALKRRTGPMPRWAQTTTWWLLAINILEAVACDAVRSPLIAVAGSLLLLTQARPGRISLGASPWRDLRHDLGGGWLLAYSLWNFSFIYGDSDLTGFAVIHLGAPLLVALGRPERWLQARMVALVLLCTLRMSLPDPPFLLRTPGWYEPQAARLLDVAAAVAALVLAARSALRAWRTGEARDLAGWLAVRLAAPRGAAVEAR